MSRKRKAKNAVPEEVLAEGSGPVEGEVSIEPGDAQVLADAASEVLADVEQASEALGDEVGGDAEVLADAASDDAQVLADAASEAVSDEVVATVEEGEQGSVVGDDEPQEPALEAGETGEAGEAEGAALPTSAASMEPAELRRLVEALIFASDKPMTLLRLRQLTRVSDMRRLEAALAELTEEYRERGIALQSVSGGYQFRTNTKYSTWVQQLIAGRPVRLSRAQLETLSIIAYRQPITRPEIDDIRGVDSSGTLRVLAERSLIRILGKKEEVGRPLLYGTTKEFLDFFSLADLRELPTLREYSELTDESRRVMTDRLGADPDADLVIEDDPADAPLAAEAAPADGLTETVLASELADKEVAPDVVATEPEPSE